MSAVFLVLSAFLASAVEMVEALTIVLAVGVTRGWRSALTGVSAAVLALAAIVGALGPSLVLLPLDVLRCVIGALLLIFGLQWLRKAILRAAGAKPKHDERGIYEQQRAAAVRDAAAREAAAGADRVWGWLDPYSFAVAFKGVLLEGLEVAFVVLAFGANRHRVGLGALAAGAAVLVVALAGALLRAPLARVPENAMKFAVGVMLSSFGMFW